MKTDYVTIIRQYNLHHILRHMTTVVPVYYYGTTLWCHYWRVLFRPYQMSYYDTLLYCQYTTVTQHCGAIIGQYYFHRTRCHTVVQYAPMTHFSSDRVRQ